MRIGVVLAVVLGLFAAGCSTTMIPRPPVDRQALQPYLKQGSGSATGQAFRLQRGGGVVFAAGRDVILVPALPDLQQNYTRPLRRWERLAGWLDPESAKAVRHVVANAQGQFKFSDLPAGRYFLKTTVDWYVAGEYQGGDLVSYFELRDGEAKEVIMSRGRGEEEDDDV